MHQTVTIKAVGNRGDGVAAGPLFVPYTLPGESVEIESGGERARLLSVIAPSPERIEPFCGLFGQCGGCAIQHWSEAGYRAWKRGLVVEALEAAGIDAVVEELVDAHGEGRRRATLHARKGKLGFAEARSHEIIALENCPILVPALNAVLPAIAMIERALRGLKKSIDFVLTAGLSGVDCDIRGAGKIEESLRHKLAAFAGDHDFARLSVHGDVVVERRPPQVVFAGRAVTPPPGAFLQATQAADEILAALVLEGVAGAKRIADLFCGCGTLSLPLAQGAHVHAYDSDKAAVAALERGTHVPGLKPVVAQMRDLFHRPLLAEELKGFDALVFDPPRAGAAAQAKRLAASKIRRIVAVSCNPATFAVDATLLLAGGYRLTRLTPVDQFRHSAHVEIVALFER